MSYITAAALLDSPGPKILGEIAAPLDMPAVVGDLMRLTIEGGVRTAYTAEEQAAADEALVQINSVVDEVDGIIDGYLGSRYSVPINPVPKILQAYARDLVTARLYRDGGPEAVMKRAASAEKFLQQLAAGKITLGAGDETQQGNDVRTSRDESDRTFDDNSLKDFGAGL